MDCSICFNNITDHNKVVTECNHIFHFTCLYKNFKNNPNTGEQCPLCRKSFNTNSALEHNNANLFTSNTRINPTLRTIGEQQFQIIRNLYRRTEVNTRTTSNHYPAPRSRPIPSQNTLIRIINNRQTRRRPIRTVYTEPQSIRRQEIKDQIAKLSFERLKITLREKGVSAIFGHFMRTF